MAAMNIKIDGLVFDRANYDADGDVLYLARGESAEASDAAFTPEGHGIRYDAEGRVIGLTIINARLLLDRDGHPDDHASARASCRRERPRGGTLVNVFPLRPLFL
jgi:uncharacterized protein YuzE